MPQWAHAPSAINCPLCNGKYFKHSFPIHFEQCQVLPAQTHEKCKYCKREVHIDQIMEHKERCLQDKMKRRSSSISRPSSSSQLSPSSQKIKLRASGISNQENDHRLQCKYCQRKFNPNRIEKHESICSSLKPGSRSPIKLKPSSNQKPKPVIRRRAKLKKPKPIKTPANTPPSSGLNQRNESSTKSRTRELVIHYEALPTKLQLQILEITKSFHRMM